MLELVRKELAELFRGTAERFGHEIVSMEIALDHVHLFVECDPKWSPAEIAKQFKGYSGRTIFKRHPEIKQRYFWEAVCGRMDTTLGRLVRCPRMWFVGTSRRPNIRRAYAIHPRVT